MFESLPTHDKIMSQANNKARLTVPRDEARNKLNDRIEKIKKISGRLLPPEALAGAIDFEKRWYEYNRELLATLFTTHHYKDEYAIAAAEHPITQVGDQYFRAHSKDFSIRLHLKIKSQVRTLQSI